MKDFEIWRRIALSAADMPFRAVGRGLWVPPIEPIGDLPYELAGLLPNRDQGRDLMAMIDGLPENERGDRAVVGVFAADPFLDCKRLARRLLAKGYPEVVNIPSVSSYGSDFSSTLDKVAAGRVQEQRNIHRLEKLGMTVSLAVSTTEGLPEAEDRSYRRLWVVPGFDMVQGGEIRNDRLLELCSKAVRITDAAVILAAGSTGITPMEAAVAGARGILLDSDDS